LQLNADKSELILFASRSTLEKAVSQGHRTRILIIYNQNSGAYRPISITPVLSRILERIIVRSFLYPAIVSPHVSFDFADQYAFRPTGSTTAALIAMLHSITQLLSTNPYVVVLALDFPQAFDSARHATLLQMIAQLDLPDPVYNWFTNFFSERSHCVRYEGEVQPH